MSSLRKRLSLIAGLGLVTSGLLVAPAEANPAGTGLVISEVYGGGGNSGAAYKNDFIELHNPTGASIPVGGMSVQYRSANGTTATAVTALTGSVPAGGHYLIQEAAGAGGTTDLPTPDATGNIAMGGTGSQVWLSTGTTALTPPAGNVSVLGIADFVGVGTAATSFETAPTAATANATSATRKADGATDTDNNAGDFTVTAPTPQNAGVVVPPPDEFTGTIAEIQGTKTDTSPHVDDIATTEGVVTAAYPTGGYNGFFLQTAGTGGGADATPGASDAIFVFGSAATATVAKGDHVRVVGRVTEFAGQTEIETDAAGDVTQLPAATAPTPLATTLPTTDAAREAHEGELIAPTGPFTVTNTFTTNQYAEIGLAAGTTPLIAPTEIADAQDAPAIAATTADNASRAVTLDDGASLNFLGAANQSTPLPWLSATNPVRVGAPVTFTGPVVLDYRNGVWKFQPTSQVTGEGAATATFANTRTSAPEDVGGDIRLATFNVLNYFPTTADEYVAMGGGRACTTYKDRAGNPITANACTPNGPRGAANPENLARQQAKIVTAINKLGAGIVSLEELENSVQFGKDRDFAISTLVTALNAAAGSHVWAFAPSPAAADLPLPSQEDVIRTGFIYKPADVALVGVSQVLIDETHFANAREPLAQAFKAVGTPDSEAFAVIVNHFKSKGSGVDDGTGQGNANPDRVGQAQALTTFASSFATSRNTDKVFLAGDFNSYSMEDPMQILYGAGYTAIDSNQAGEETYSFSGLSGSLDHVLANAAALDIVTGADVWNINSGESLAFEYSRDNYNVTNFYQPDQYRASDHDPEIVGLDLAQVLTTVSATAAPYAYGSPGTVEVSVAPASATGTVTVLDGSAELGTSTLTGGSTAVTIPGTALEPGSHTLTVNYGGDARHEASSGTVTTVVDKAASTTAATASPSTVVVNHDQTAVTVAVTGPGGVPTGQVQAYVDGALVDSATLASGMATLTVGPFNTIGTQTIEVRYLGDAHVTASQDNASVEVVGPEKLDPTITASHSPDKVVVDKTRAKLTVHVSADGVTPTGWVHVQVPGHGATVVQLKHGRVKLDLPKFDTTGDKELVITYDGNAEVDAGTITHVVTVTKKG